MNQLARQLFPEKAALFDARRCTGENCEKVITGASDFRDILSEKEYSISGLCQSCQDKIFG